MNPLVSIIVPCYNQAHFLDEALQSVLEQTYPNWECIIVNDGSPDHTEKVAKQWTKKDTRFVYLFKENGGLSSARNGGVIISKGEFILPLDSDDVLDPSYLTKLVPVLKKDSTLGIASCYSNFFYGTKKNIIFQMKPKGFENLYLLYVNQLIATSLYRKECWEQSGGYDENMKKGFEDWDFWLNVTKKGWKYIIIPEFLFYYRKAQSSMLTNTIKNHTEEVKQYIFTKHKELYIQDFNNCMEVLFYELRVQREGHQKFKNSLEYKLGKLILNPYRWCCKWFTKIKTSP
ncbi:glycosyltransferase family 2 protein [Flavobacterium sp. 7A]|uniref:glycosyltransferase family 2 protein n=1 Tax=Flavobacterium sp. 7A TaxID=2940571 RepID=UPI002225C247|nr:glycosyltransferase family A protein [Flavobacterium sp. 7A]MCW2119436.1 glycosyltransferase involved in cell wall biosynthesis [Flavobacterium sp. 7A]